LKNLNINGNITLVESVIDMTDAEYNSRKDFEKTGETIDDTRQMAGQSPYVINAGIIYSNADKGIDAGFFYNVKGSTLSIVGGGLFPDIYQESFHNLSFGANKKLGKGKQTVIDVKVSNLLNDRIESVYKSYKANNQIYSSLNPSMSISIGLSHKF
jgi:hypothetical protein